VQLAVFKANLIANYRTSHPVGLAEVRAIKTMPPICGSIKLIVDSYKQNLKKSFIYLESESNDT
jgi:hypothetical protein